jgi:hypothetical protein
MMTLKWTTILTSIAIAMATSPSAWAACGGTQINWDGTTNSNWNSTANWTPGNIPNATTEDVYVSMGVRTLRFNLTTSIGCLETAGGTIDASFANTLGITGDYFRNLNAGTITAVATTHVLNMAGNAAMTQYLDNVDPLGVVRVTNTNASYQLRMRYPFKINQQLDLTTAMTAGTVVIEDVVEIGATSTVNLTIPSGVTVEIASGGSLKFRAAGGGARQIVVQSGGTLRVQGGGSIALASGNTLVVNSGGTLDLNGSAGNIARIEGDGAGSSFIFNMNGTMTANYFKITRPTAAGLNVGTTGTISSMGNGEFHYLAANGYGITLATTSVFPGSMTNLGFFNESGNANVRNIDASAYTAAQSTLLSGYAGDVGGAAFENDSASCGSGCLNWTAPQTVKIVVNNATTAGTPPTTITPATTSTFLTLAFSLNQASTATDIQSISYTMTGTADGGDLDLINVYKDDGTTACQWDASDSLVGSYTATGSPGAFTVSGITGVSVSGTTPVCIHLRASPSATAVNGATIGFEIGSTADVTNSQNYSFSDASGPPVVSDFSQITGVTTRDWRARTSINWSTSQNWTSNTVPTSTENCDIGPANYVCTINTTPVNCQTVRLLTGGTLASTAGTNIFNIYGNLEGQSGYTFNSPYPDLRFVGSANQSIVLGTTFPGNITVNQGAAGFVVGVDGDSTIGGSLTITQGKLRINSGVTLTVTGGVTINGANGALDIEPGGTLNLGNGSTLSMSSGTLEMIGTSSSLATVTASGGGSNKYSVNLTGGTLKAQYYQVDRLSSGGFTVGAGVSVDSTYFLQNGSFTYPVDSSTQMLRLFRKIPGNTFPMITFDSAGSSATSIVSIYTDNSIAAPSENFVIDNWSGDLAGVGTESSGTNYPVIWGTAVNTIDLTRQAGDVGPANVNAGTTNFMGRFRFEQTNAGAYSSTDITSIRLTMTGTGTGSDISAVRIYYDSTCTATSGGTLVGSGTFSGSPGTVTISGITGVTLNATPSVNVACIYVEYDISATATNGVTVGAKINAGADVVNSASYGFAVVADPPVDLGTAATVIGSTTTVWTGTGGSNWNTAGSWTAGIPDSTKNCTINSAATAPIIAAGFTASCKTVTIASGATLTLTDATSTLRVYQNFANSGTFTQNGGALEFWDAGTAITQTISSSTALTSMSFANKTGTGATSIAKTGGSFTITNQLVIPTSTNFEFQVQNGHTLTLSSGLNVQAGTFNIQSGGTLSIGNGQAVNVSGGTFKIAGVNDAYPQTTTNKGTVTTSGTSWSFTSSSGNVDLTGFLLDKIDTNGLRISGTTRLVALSGGQFTRLQNAAANPGMKAIWMNTTTTPSIGTALNVGWNWQTANSMYLAGTSPAVGDSYYLFYADNCNGGSITFDQWFGDFFQDVDVPSANSKTSATNCSVSIAASASPVSLMSFGAIGYNAAVAVNWVTGSELDHAGFNVYRSLDPTTGFIQVNNSLIRNFNSSASFHGVYRYVDNDVVNGLTYFYKIEDIATNGLKKMHGPVSAMPQAHLGAVPAAGSGTNSGGSSNDPNNGNGISTGPIAAPGAVDLGNGIHILSQTRHALRLEIDPPAPVYSVSSWNASYEKVEIAGYSSTLESDKPELVERDLLIEVENGTGTVSVLNSSVTEAAVSTHQIQPAPSWSLSGGILVPTYTPYSTAVSMPTDFYEISSSTEQAAGKTYLRIKVRPLLYNASNGATRFSDKIVLDLGLNGGSWNSVPASNLGLSPAASTGVLRMKYRVSGMYELTLADLVAAGLDGPFRGANTSHFRLYVDGTEVPIQILSANGTFQDGDKLRFYLLYVPLLEDRDNEAVLSTYEIGTSGNAALRMPAPLNANPASYPDSDEVSLLSQAFAEQNNIALFGEPLGEGLDHFYWAQLWAPNDGTPPAPESTLNVTVSLPHLDRSSPNPVRVFVTVKGNRAMAMNGVHHLGVWINTVPAMAADKVFNDTDPVTLQFNIPAVYFADGGNTIKLQVIPDQVSPGDYDIISIDKVQVDYRSFPIVEDDSIVINNRRLGHAVLVDGFSGSANPLVYDISDPSTPAPLSGFSLFSPDGGATQSVKFAADGTRYVLLDPSRLLKPVSIELGYGYDNPLKDTSQGADLIILGDSRLLDEARDLIETRRMQGLRVTAVDLDQVYAEFSHGHKSSQAIRDFVRFVYQSWAAPAPKYLLILGDSTYDPKDNLGYGVSSGTMPMPLELGEYLDFGSDHWFVASDSGMPLMAVGRIPFAHSVQVAQTIAKILAYESGTLAPTSEGAKKLTFIADRDTLSEDFLSKSSQLAATASQIRSSFSSSIINRASMPNDAATQAAIVSAFNDSPLVLTFLGHGAEDRWTGGNVFLTPQADALSNSRLPIVLGLDCLNSYTYDANPNYFSIGGKLLSNASAGAVAFWGSTTMTTTPAQTALARNFLTELAGELRAGPHTVRLGDLMVRAKIALGNSVSTTDVLRSYSLLGDPSMSIPYNAFDPAPAAAPASEDKGGGFACGTISSGGSGSGGPGAGALVELVLILATLWFSCRKRGAIRNSL